MSFWAIFWGVVFVGTLVVYFGVAVVVAVGGWRDIRAMLSQLDEQDTGE